MQLLNQLKCLFRGHALGELEPDVFWFSATCHCCGKTVTADTALELLMMRREDSRSESPLSAPQLQAVREIASAV